MNFEEALVVEFNLILGLENKVFPLRATEGIDPPFLLYISSDGEQLQTLTGFHESIAITCEIHVIANYYAELKQLTKAVIESIKSFQGRVIGIDGPLIKSVFYEQPTEMYEPEVRFYRASFDLRVRI
jgi:hypothetical protein